MSPPYKEGLKGGGGSGACLFETGRESVSRTTVLISKTINALISRIFAVESDV